MKKIKSKRKIRKIKKRAALVSVVMPVYNAENYLCQAINSVLKQTFRDFEFIIVDDASTDESFKIIKRFAARSRRIKVLRNEKRMGVSITVKRAMDQARGSFIARMDADDVSFTKRFEKQVEYLRTNPKTVAVGVQSVLIDGRGRAIDKKKFLTLFEKIYNYIDRFIPIRQSTFMIAKKRLPRDFEYSPNSIKWVADPTLILRLFKYGNVGNLPEKLLKYRVRDVTFLTDLQEAFSLTFSYLSRLFLAISK